MKRLKEGRGDWAPCQKQQPRNERQIYIYIYFFFYQSQVLGFGGVFIFYFAVLQVHFFLSNILCASFAVLSKLEKKLCRITNGPHFLMVVFYGLREEYVLFRKNQD